MTVADAVAWCNQHVGQAMDFDGVYGAQCTDFFNYYYQFITGRNPLTDAGGVAGAKDLWTVDLPNFTKVANNMADPNQLPPQGAILIYDGGLAGSGGYGHVAVVDSANAQQVTVWDQNWGGMYVHHQAHMWTGHELGWLIYQGFDTFITLDQLTALYRTLLNRDPDASGIAHYVGHYTASFVEQDIKNSPEYAQLHAPQPAPVTPPEPPQPAPAPQPAPTPIPAPEPPVAPPSEPPDPSTPTTPSTPPAPTVQPVEKPTKDAAPSSEGGWWTRLLRALINVLTQLGAGKKA